MGKQLALYLFTCGPLVITTAAWAKLYWTRQWPHRIALTALGIVSGNAALAAVTVLYYELGPTRAWLPPWQDPEVLNLAFLSLLAPVGMIAGIIAGVKGAPKWLVGTLEIASLPLAVVGFFAVVSV